MRLISLLQTFCPSFFSIIAEQPPKGFPCYLGVLRTEASLFQCSTLLAKSSIFRCNNFVDLVVIDRPKQHVRFSLIIISQSIFFRYRLLLKLFTSEQQGVPSLAVLFPGIVWFERQAWDLFGIFFYDNQDLSRILTDYSFQGFPLRKDFPLTGFLEVRYDDSCEYLVYEPVELMQEFRNFEFLSPWETITTPASVK